MKLKPASGGPEMTAALSHSYVRKIVDILLLVIDEEFFRGVALFLNTYYHSTQPDFAAALDDLRENFQVFPDGDGLFTPPAYVDEIIHLLGTLYRQNEKIVGFQRGAIVELLAFKLVSLRFRPNECLSNQRFIDMHSREITDQIDVAVLSRDKNRVEGYECKMKASGSYGIASEDCNNLRALAKAAQNEGYFVHVGVVSFDNDMLVKRRLKHFDAPLYIKAYGLNSIGDLRETPLYVKPDENPARY